MSPTPCVNFIRIGGPNGQTICGRVPFTNIAELINRVLAFLFPVASIILLAVLVWGGFDYLTSAGNPEKVKSAQAKITSGIIGFLILAFAYGITKLVAYILGFKDLF